MREPEQNQDLSMLSTPLPALVIVSGLPASGKSTLAEHIARELGWPLFTKDAFKERLFDTGAIDPDQFDRSASGVLGAQAVAILLDVMTTLIGARVNVVVESNFRPHLARKDLGPMLGVANGRQVHCTLEREQIIERYRVRFEGRARHPVHLDSIAIHELNAQIDAGFGEPLPLDAPLISVDTQNGYRPALDEIIAFCR